MLVLRRRQHVFANDDTPLSVFFIANYFYEKLKHTHVIGFKPNYVSDTHIVFLS